MRPLRIILAVAMPAFAAPIVAKALDALEAEIDEAEAK